MNEDLVEDLIEELVEDLLEDLVEDLVFCLLYKFSWYSDFIDSQIEQYYFWLSASRIRHDAGDPPPWLERMDWNVL